MKQHVKERIAVHVPPSFMKKERHSFVFHGAIHACTMHAGLARLLLYMPGSTAIDGRDAIARKSLPSPPRPFIHPYREGRRGCYRRGLQSLATTTRVHPSINNSNTLLAVPAPPVLDRSGGGRFPWQ